LIKPNNKKKNLKEKIALCSSSVYISKQTNRTSTNFLRKIIVEKYETSESLETSALKGIRD